MTVPGVVIAGGGLAGFQLASSLRDMGYARRISLICEESVPPYHRPPLSKAFLMGPMDPAKLQMRGESHYAEKGIEVLCQRRVVAVDRTNCIAGLDDDSKLEYSHFVFATGARNRPLPVPGHDFGGVFFLRSLDEALRLKARLAGVRRVVVLGAGFIGLEFAAAARKLGADVTAIDVADRPMARALSVPMSQVFAREHARNGVHQRFNTQVLRILEENGEAAGVELMSGETIAADLVLIGIGVQPNIEVAAACGLEVGNGIVVDAQLATADPRVSAIGDCAAHPSIHSLGHMTRLESVQNATDQAKCVAARIVGKPYDYAAVPWFWSDQGDLKLQIAGLTTGMDQTVIRDDPAAPACTVFCYREGRLLGIETLNRPADHMAARKILAQRIALTPEQAADAHLELKQLVAAAPVHA